MDEKMRGPATTNRHPFFSLPNPAHIGASTRLLAARFIVFFAIFCAFIVVATMLVLAVKTDKLAEFRRSLDAERYSNSPMRTLSYSSTDESFWFALNDAFYSFENLVGGCSLLILVAAFLFLTFKRRTRGIANTTPTQAEIKTEQQGFESIEHKQK